jgi:sarcosine oxidase
MVCAGIVSLGESMTDRRSFLKGAGLALAAAPVAAVAQPQASRSSRVPTGAPDVVVVGAGAFGGFTALTLRERGLKVVSLDQYGPSNPRSASAGETRSIRSGYGADARFSAWATKAMTLWNARIPEFGREIMFPNDRIEIAREWLPNMVAQRKIFDDQKIPYEILDRAQLRTRYPQMNFDDAEFAFVETGKSAAVIKSREAMIVVSELFQKKGGEFRVARAMLGPVQGRKLLAVDVGHGETISAGQFVFACGPWSAKTLPNVMGPKVSVGRSEYYYWGVPAGDDRFSWPKQPAWHDHIHGGYGFGSIERGLKYSPAGSGGVTQDPDSAERLPSPMPLKNGREYIARRFPDMRNAPIVETRVCNMENVGSNDFIIDRHPDYDNVWIASGGGGHGFKHGPIVGEYVADRLMGRASFDPAADEIFKLSAHPDRRVGR